MYRLANTVFILAVAFMIADFFYPCPLFSIILLPLAIATTFLFFRLSMLYEDERDE